MEQDTFALLAKVTAEGHEITNPFRKTYGPHVKIVCKPAAPPSCDLVVMVRNYKCERCVPAYGWTEVARFNDMSDDLAHTNAHARAIHERAKILEGE